jgi:hypothetical protein
MLTTQFHLVRLSFIKTTFLYRYHMKITIFSRTFSSNNCLLICAVLINAKYKRSFTLSYTTLRAKYYS